MVLGVHRHDPAMGRDLLKYLPQMPVRTPGVKSGEDLEAGYPSLDGFAYFADKARWNGARQYEVKSVVGVGVTVEGNPSLLHLPHDGV